MSFVLRIIQGNNLGVEYQLNEGQEYLVGRSHHADIKVFDPTRKTSGKHFLITAYKDEAVLVPQNAPNGTFVDDIQVKEFEEIHLQPGQTINAGGNLKFLFDAYIERAENISGEDDETVLLPRKHSVMKFDANTANARPGDDRSEMTGDNTLPTQFDTSLKEQTAMENNTLPTQFDTSLKEQTAMENNTLPTQFDTSLKEQTAAVSETAVSRSADCSADHSTDHSTDHSSLEIALSRAKTLEDIPSPEPFPAYTEKNDETAKGEPQTGRTFAATQEDPIVEDSSDAPTMGEMNAGEDTLDQTITLGADGTNGGTKAIDPETIKAIKEEQQRKQKKHVFLQFLAIFLFALLVLFCAMLKPKQNPNDLSWPTATVNGRTVHPKKFYDAWVPYEKGGFHLYVPNWDKDNKMTQDGNRIEIHSYLGKKGLIPLDVILTKDDSPENVYEDFDTALEKTLKKISDNPDEKISFDGLPVPAFFTPAYGGGDNGIPYMYVLYQHDRERTWFGILSFFRIGSCIYTLRAEVPGSETERKSVIDNLAELFIDFHPIYVRKHWEGSSSFDQSTELEEMLYQAKQKKSSSYDTPNHFPEYEFQLQSILAKAAVEKNQAVYNEAIDLLLGLRNKQDEYYNRQRIKWESAKGTPVLLEEIRRESLSFFLHQDKRYKDILSWK